MGATHALGRPLGGFDARWLLLGSVLPDIVPRGLGAVARAFDVVEGFLAVETSIVLGMLHTPFSVGLLCAALTVLATDRRAAASGLFLGAMAHLVLDAMQRSVGGGVAFLFPFALEPYALHWAWWDQPATYAVAALCAVYLVVVRWRRGAVPPRPSPVTLRRGRCAVAALLLVAYVVTPLFRVEAAVGRNAGNALLALHPADFDGQVIGLGQVDILEVGGAEVTVEIGDLVLRIDWPDQPSVEVGDRVSLRGELDGLRVRPTETAFVHARGTKKAISLAGALLLVLFWWPGRSARPRSAPSP